MNNYREIEIEEMPNGCVLSNNKGMEILIRTEEDAFAIIQSLQKMMFTDFMRSLNSKKDKKK